MAIALLCIQRVWPLADFSGANAYGSLLINVRSFENMKLL
jgi:hypothetical protein